MKKKKSEMYRNEIKSYIVRAGMTMSEGWIIWQTSMDGAAAFPICPVS